MNFHIPVSRTFQIFLPVLIFLLLLNLLYSQLTTPVYAQTTCPDGITFCPVGTFCDPLIDPITGIPSGWHCPTTSSSSSCSGFVNCLRGIVSPAGGGGLPWTQSGTGLPALIINAFFIPIVFILGFVAIYYMILASIRLIISRGEPEKVAEARSRLIYAVVGFIVLLLAYASLQFIEQVFLKTFISR